MTTTTEARAMTLALLATVNKLYITTIVNVHGSRTISSSCWSLVPRQ